MHFRILCKYFIYCMPKDKRQLPSPCSFLSECSSKSDLIISLCFHGLYWTQRDTSTRHIAVRRGGMSSWALCVSCMLSNPVVSFFALQDCLCVVCLCVCHSVCVCLCAMAPRRGAVGWQSRPVVVTAPGVASGTIWPLWKSSAGATSEQARGNPKRRGWFKNGQSCRNKTEQSIERAKSQFALRPGRCLEAHKSSSLRAL